MLICKPLPTHTAGEDVCNLNDMYMAEKDLSWKHFVDIFTGGAQRVLSHMLNLLHQNAQN
jgi:hypothetical protein